MADVHMHVSLEALACILCISSSVTGRVNFTVAICCGHVSQVGVQPLCGHHSDCSKRDGICIGLHA